MVVQEIVEVYIPDNRENGEMDMCHAGPNNRIHDIINYGEENMDYMYDSKKQTLDKVKKMKEISLAKGSGIEYGVADDPPWYLCALLGFQVRIFSPVFFNTCFIQ